MKKKGCFVIIIVGWSGWLAFIPESYSEEANSYYVERRSYGTQKESEPPRYVKAVNKTWLNEFSSFQDVDWLQIGFEHRLRYEYRQNDFRRNIEKTDEPFLNRTRLYLGIQHALDPLRFGLEISDASRSHSAFSRLDTRDINYAEPIQAFAELYWKETPLGNDDLGHSRPVNIKFGRQAFEYLDRRLISRNEWRNTTNTFQGLRATIGEKNNDWQLDLFAVKPLQRYTDRLDEVDHAQDFYGLIGDWRRWSKVVTFQPYYLLLKQQGNEVQYDINGNRLSGSTLSSAQIDRTIHTGGLRMYGLIPTTQLDFDASLVKQWGEQQRFLNKRLGYIEVDHKAYAYNAEVGYSFQHTWKPRLSAYYGLATGDKNPATGLDSTQNERFDRLFGFARPWSNDDYIQMENIRTPKVRLEFEPTLSWFKGLKVDTGYSWYALESDSDRWNAGANLRDRTGRSGDSIGREWDLRLRFPVEKHVAANIGYAHFWAGEFTKMPFNWPRMLMTLNAPVRQTSCISS